MRAKLEEQQTLSIPFHENLTIKEINKIVTNIKKWKI